MEISYKFLWLIYAVGIVFLALELFVPGAIMGIVGFCMLLGSAGYCFYQGFVYSGIAMIAIALVAIPGALMMVLPKLALKNELSSDEGFSEREQYLDLVEREGRAISSLRPTGTAEFDGKRFSVYAETGMIDEGEAIRVIRVEGNRIFVRPVDE